VDYIRINTAYGDYDQYDQILGYYRQYASAVDTKIIFDIKDLSKLDYFVKNKLDMVAASFVNYPEQLREIKEKSNNAYIISKIETVLGVQNIDSILAQTDGLMIARGDLSEAESIEKIPVLQKDLTRKAVASGKFLVTATEMLLSMINNPKPTIAEISDVSNAVFDGSDAVMLSEETATGKYPIEAVSYMRRAIEEAEKWMESEKI
jgi:pyruvate kinase